MIGYHGTPGDDEGTLLPHTPEDEVLTRMAGRKGRLGFGGHTHRAMDRSVGGWRIVNVGSVGIPADELRACYALVTFTQDMATVELRRVDYDREAAIDDLKRRGNPGWEWFAGHLKG